MQDQTPSPSWVVELAPYVPGKSVAELERELGITDIVKLASNENPAGPSPKVVEAVTRAALELSRYPDSPSFELREKLAHTLGVGRERLVVGSGSNELITLAIRAIAQPGVNIVVPRYAFIAYSICARASGVDVREVGGDDFAFDVEGLVAACDASTRILFVANPNNPTGASLPAGAIEYLFARTPSHVLVVIDEAYFEYANPGICPTALGFAEVRENFAVLRTFSKAYGIAGARVGYGVFPEYFADRLHRVRDPFNVGHLSQVAAAAALGDEEYLAASVRENAENRGELFDSLAGLGVRAWPSEGNFVMVQVPSGGAAVFEGLLRRGVIVRPLGAYGLPDHLRITVGTRVECARFVAALSEVLLAMRA